MALVKGDRLTYFGGGEAQLAPMAISIALAEGAPRAPAPSAPRESFWAALVLETLR